MRASVKNIRFGINMIRHYYIKQQFLVLGRVFSQWYDSRFVFLSNPFNPYCPEIEGVSSMNWFFCRPLRHISYFFVVFCGWKSNHMITKTQFWMTSSGCGCSETHQISRPMGILDIKFILGKIFWKLAKTPSIQFSNTLWQVGFPTQ